MEILSNSKNENAILIDWLSVVFHDVQVDDVKRLLGLADPDIDWQDRLAFRHGYPRQCSFANIVIRYGADDAANYKDDDTSMAVDKVRHDMGIMLDMSGTACRSFETYGHGDWLKLLGDICALETRTHFTRLDLSYDDHTGILDLHRIRTDVEDRNYTGCPKKARIQWSDNQETDIHGLTVYIGSEKSPVFVRIYDKAAERGFKDRHWIRVEMVLRHDRATVAIAEILLRQNVGETYSGILRNYCCFRTPTNDINKSRWPIADYWDKLIAGVGRIRLWISPGEPYNFRKTEDQMILQYGQALQAYVEIHGSIQDLLCRSKQAHPELNKKYKMAISQAKLEQKQARDAAINLRKQIVAAEMKEIFGDDQMSFDL